MHRERGRQVPHILVPTRDMPFGQRETLALQREELVDQLRPREWCAARRRIAPMALPQAEQPRLKRQRIAAKRSASRVFARSSGPRSSRLKWAQQDWGVP